MQSCCSGEGALAKMDGWRLRRKLPERFKLMEWEKVGIDKNIDNY